MDINSFIDSQLAEWDEVAERYEYLGQATTKMVRCNGVEWAVTLNPSRKVSTAARVDAASIAARPCFLCEKNRPAIQHKYPWREYDILVNPFPVFPRHLTIVSRSHCPQLVGDVETIVSLAGELSDFTVFYNGASCGASAPDHKHFQAVPHEYLPIDRKYPFKRYYVSGKKDNVISQLTQILAGLETEEGEREPRVNMAVHYLGDETFEAVIVPRKAHRPSCYEHIKVSPGAIDVLGTIITTDKNDYDSLDGTQLEEIWNDVAFPSEQKMINVGIMTSDRIDFVLHGDYSCEGDTYRALTPQSSFSLDNVTIGVNFHWQRNERQSFSGDLRILKKGERYTAINRVPLEEYLLSVIASEMSENASVELLKTHAVISRSWALAQLRAKSEKVACGCENNNDEVIKWYDHDDHDDFDVCADDHCQRYQGIARVTRSEVKRAIYATWGEVLMSDGELCDARFSKCCGGAFEEFEFCWAPQHHSYLEGGRDILPMRPLPDLRKESEARRWIMSKPEAFCSDVDDAVLKQILNDYDRDTADFYRWRVDYTVEELSDLVKSKSGIDFGTVTELRPLSRGVSGRIYRLEIVGDKRTVVVGKELEIRRWLSPTHLYSSAFVVDRTECGFTLYGAGWGHGVGLCQIGAAVMAEKGYGYREILAHYFKNSTVEKIY